MLCYLINPHNSASSNFIASRAETQKYSVNGVRLELYLCAHLAMLTHRGDEETSGEKVLNLTSVDTYQVCPTDRGQCCQNKFAEEIRKPLKENSPEEKNEYVTVNPAHKQ